MVKPAGSTHNPNDPVYSSVPDVSVRAKEDVTAPRDWTIHRPDPEKVEIPPPKPMSQLLMDHLKTIWTASASAIQMEQVKDQLTEPLPVTPTDAPGLFAKQSMMYKPSKVNKTENI